MIESISLAKWCIEKVLQQVQWNVRKKELQQLAVQNVKDQILPLHKQFVTFLSNHQIIIDKKQKEQCPTKIAKDSYSRLNTNVSHDKSNNSLNASMIKTSSRKFSIAKTRSRNQSMVKSVIINRDKLQHFRKLSQQPQIPQNQLQSKLRKYYLNNLEAKEKQLQNERALKQIQQKQKIQRQKVKAQRSQRLLTYDYNGKAIEYCQNNKMQGLLTMIKSRIAKRQKTKKLEKKDVLEQTIKLQSYQSPNTSKKRKLSCIRQSDIKQISHIFNSTTKTPIFQPLQSTQHKTSLQYKLSQFRTQSCRFKSLQPVSSQSLNKHSIRSLQLPTPLTSKKSLRLNTDHHNQKRTPYFNPIKLSSSKQQIQDTIYLNPELYQSLLI